MRYTDVAIVGGGLAGSTAAAMLGRAGISAVLIDPHPVYPPDFRAKNSAATQLDLFRRTGSRSATLRAATLDGEVWIARFGHLLAKKPSDQHGIMYDTLVNAMRAEIPRDGRDDLRQMPSHCRPARNGRRSNCRLARKSRRGSSCSPTD